MSPDFESKPSARFQGVRSEASKYWGITPAPSERLEPIYNCLGLAAAEFTEIDCHRLAQLDRIATALTQVRERVDSAPQRYAGSNPFTDDQFPFTFKLGQYFSPYSVHDQPSVIEAKLDALQKWCEGHSDRFPELKHLLRNRNPIVQLIEIENRLHSLYTTTARQLERLAHLRDGGAPLIWLDRPAATPELFSGVLLNDLPLRLVTSCSKLDAIDLLTKIDLTAATEQVVTVARKVLTELGIDSFQTHGVSTAEWCTRLDAYIQTELLPNRLVLPVRTRIKLYQLASFVAEINPSNKPGRALRYPWACETKSQVVDLDTAKTDDLVDDLRGPDWNAIPVLPTASTDLHSPPLDVWRDAQLINWCVRHMHDCGLGDVICLEFRGGEWSVVSHYPTHISTYDCRSLYRYLPQVLGYVWEGYRNAGDSSRVVELQEFHETLRAIHGNTGLHPLRSCTWGYLGFICSTEHGSTKDSQNAPQYAFLIFGPEGARQPNDSEFSTWLEEVEETLRFSHRIQRRMGIDTPMFE